MNRRAALTVLLTAGLLMGSAGAAHADDTPAPVDPGVTAPAQPAPSADPLPVPTPPIEPPPIPTPDPPKPPVAVSSDLPLGKGAKGWRVREVQQRLTWMGYQIDERNITSSTVGASTMSAVKAFQSKFSYKPTGKVGPMTWDLLREVSGTVGKLPKACTEETSLCIDKSQRLLRYVVKGKVLLTLDARFGMSGLETDEGLFRVNRKSRDHVSSLYRTWMPFAMFFSGGQAVHYSPYFARDGYSGGSHGCVGLRLIDRARWLFDRVPLGTRVNVYRS